MRKLTYNALILVAFSQFVFAMGALYEHALSRAW